MKFPDDFWEEFDRRLDARLDEKLNKKFDEFEKKIDAKLEKTDKKINKVIEWTQRQDKSIERELTMACYTHFQSVYNGYITVIPHKTILGNIIKDTQGLTITDFDGAIVLTNDISYATFLKQSDPKYKYDFDKASKAYLIIVEAKQHVTLSKVNKKLRQRENIEKVLRDHEFLKVIDPFIGLYIGGLDIDEDAKTVFSQFQEKHARRELVGIVDLNGNRFTVKDVKNNHGKNAIVYGGACKSK